MQAKRPGLTIVYAASARIELNKIWDYNEEGYGAEHASDYLDFLQDGIDSLVSSHGDDKPVEGYPIYSVLR